MRYASLALCFILIIGVVNAECHVVWNGPYLLVPFTLVSSKLVDKAKIYESPHTIFWASKIPWFILYACTYYNTYYAKSEWVTVEVCYCNNNLISSGNEHTIPGGIVFFTGFTHDIEIEWHEAD